MTDLYIFSLVQGVTEFLPVSSTAHLIVFEKLMHLHSLGRVTEVTIHAGTLLVVMLYFWQDIWSMVRGFFSLFRGKILPGTKLFFHLCLATLPVVIVGYVLHRYLPDLGRSLPLLGLTSIVAGVILYAADQNTPASKGLTSMTSMDALIIGCLQMTALIPGVSRSGATLIASRLLGYKRVDAARFSFLLSIPAILGAITLVTLDVIKEHTIPFDLNLLVAFGISFLVGIFILFLFMTWLKKNTLKLFALYRIIFGIFIILIWYCKL